MFMKTMKASVSFWNIFREINYCADSLAKTGVDIYRNFELRCQKQAGYGDSFQV